MVSELNPQWSERRAIRLLLLAPFILVALYAGYLWAEWKKQPTRPTEVTWERNQSTQVQSVRELTLFYPGADGKWFPEQRLIRGFETLRQELQNCLRVFFDGPTHPDAYLPGQDQISVNSVMLDGRGTVILDIRYNLQQAFNVGGVQAEYDLVQAISRTVHANYPDFQFVRFLINGESISTLAGHLDIRNGIKL